jgi:hypothetical protein
LEGVELRAELEHRDLVELLSWIDQHTSGLSLPADERSLIAIGCFDMTLELQAAVALLHQNELHGAMLALLRTLAESLVRGLWLLQCATAAELEKFKKGRIDKTFDALVVDVEAGMGTPGGVLSGFKASAWKALNGFTHTGFVQVSRRHAPGRVEATYPDHELAQALDVASALGMVAAGQLVAMSGAPELVKQFSERIAAYGARRAAPSSP